MEYLTLPAVTTAQMIEVDRLMIEEYGIALMQMMENAGCHLAEQVRRMLSDVRGRRIIILCGAGNNGGGGMVAARHLHNHGASVQVKFVGSHERLTAVPVQQHCILQRLGLIADDDLDLTQADLIVDALIGYGLTGNPHGAIAEWIERANRSARPILALDTPSGLDATTALSGSPCIRATATMTLALPKTGLLIPGARPFVGDLYLADIGVPPELYAHPALGLAVDAIFAEDSIIRVR